jgi:hypothetical protein
LIIINSFGSWSILPEQIVLLVLFVLVGLAMASVSEALRTALEKAGAAQQATTLMLDELNQNRHRHDWRWRSGARDRHGMTVRRKCL